MPVDPAPETPGDRWAEPELEIDEGSERGEPVNADKEIRVLARASRLAIGCDPATRHLSDSPGLDVIDFPCAAGLTPIPTAGSAGPGSPSISAVLLAPPSGT